MVRVKYKRWGPYVWWVCPSHKCNFENKTDLAFVQGEFETKCQYCNTPITIRMSAGQLALEYSGEGAETKAMTPTPPSPPVATPTPQPSAAAQVATTATPASVVLSRNPQAPATLLASSNEPPSASPTLGAASKDSEPGQKSGKQKKKAGS